MAVKNAIQLVHVCACEPLYNAAWDQSAGGKAPNDDGPFGCRIQDMQTNEVFESIGRATKQAAKLAAFESCWHTWLLGGRAPQLELP
eukprot:4684792-Prymnesium_polylepis.1